MNKLDLITKVKAIEGITQDERAYLINLINTKKKYGLVWEDKPEDGEELLRNNLPVLKEVKDRAILNGDEYPNHILIEGDNLHALTALTFTHENKIDVIYIDPPYNTGNKDFKYHDAFKDEAEFIEKEHTFRHSTWLSFMDKRLRIAKKLMSLDGLIFISIDDIEYSQLKLLMDEIFNQTMVNSITIKTSEASGVKMSHVEKKLPKIKEYLLIYSLSRDAVSLNPVKLAKVDDVEKFKSYSKYYSKIIIDKNKLVENWEIIPLKEYFTKNNLNIMEDDIIQFKLDNAERMVYRTNNKSLENMSFDTDTALVKSPTGLDYIWWEGKQMLFLKDYIEEGLCDLWTDISTINLNKEICGLDSFANGQKPLELIKRVFKLYPKKDITVLDFFAGSGTTLHAAMQINSEDGGKRKCILVTNNENKICEEVTYERNKRVITGYENAKGEKIEGLINNNLRYFQCDFVPSLKSEENKRKLTQSSTGLLCIKEDCYNDITEANDFDTKQCRILTNNDGKYLVIVYHSRQQLQVCVKLVTFIKTLNNLTEKIRLYGFSPEKETLTEDFIEVADKIEAVPLPDAIYNAYRATFRAIKLDKKLPTSVAGSDDEQK